MKLNTSEMPQKLKTLHAGDAVYLSGTVYTARDAAHMRLLKMIENGDELPFDLCGAAIYYSGPTPAKAGMAVGSCGPTTSSRMDKFTPALIERGVCATIGKGNRSEDVVEAMKKYGAVYFCAVGGAGALMSACVSDAEVIAFPELGCEAVRKLTVKDMPLIVGIDSFGNSILK